MSSKKYKTTKNLSVQTAHRRKIDLSHIITLPNIKHAEKYFKNFSKSCRFDRAMLFVNNLYLLIIAENEEVLVNVRKIVEKEIGIFIESSRSLQKMLT